MCIRVNTSHHHPAWAAAVDLSKILIQDYGNTHDVALPCCTPGAPAVMLLYPQREVSLLEKAADEASEDPQLSQLASSVKDCSKQLAKMESRINEVKDRLFADFR